MQTALREYLRLIFGQFRSWLSGALLGLLGVLSAAGHFSLPLWAWVSLFVACFSWVQFGAFVKVRDERDEARAAHEGRIQAELVGGHFNNYRARDGSG